MKKKPKPEGWQSRMKKEHEDAIVALLKSAGPMQFKDILAAQDKTKIKSPRGLTDVLNRLLEKRLIRNVKKVIEVSKGVPKLGLQGEIIRPAPKVKKKIDIYELTTQGETYYKEGMWWLLHELLDLQGSGAGYAHSLSSEYSLFGLSNDLILPHGDVGNLSLLIPPTPQIEDFIMEEIFKTIQTQKIKILPSKGKLILSFEFDFEKLSKTLIELQNEKKV